MRIEKGPFLVRHTHRERHRKRPFGFGSSEIDETVEYVRLERVVDEPDEEDVIQVGRIRKLSRSALAVFGLYKPEDRANAINQNGHQEEWSLGVDITLGDIEKTMVEPPADAKTLVTNSNGGSNGHVDISRLPILPPVIGMEDTFENRPAVLTHQFNQPTDIDTVREVVGSGDPLR